MRGSAHPKVFDRELDVCKTDHRPIGAVHKLCRLKGGGEGVKNCQFY